MAALSPFSSQINIIKPITNYTDPVLRLSYIPSAPTFTIRNILSALSAAKSPPFSAVISHPPSAEDLAHRIHQKEQGKTLIRLAVSVVIAIPTFIIGIVYMSLLKKTNPGRAFFEETIWAGQGSRGEWALFILATPVMLYCAEVSALCPTFMRWMIINHYRISIAGPLKNFMHSGGPEVQLRF
jgi:P-type Cu+ transporter